MIVTNAGKCQQLLTIGNRHRADIQLFVQHLGHLHAVNLVESLTQNTFRRGGNFERSSGKSGGVFFKHRPFIEQYTHKQGCAHGIGDHHRRGNIADQPKRIIKRTSN